MMLVITSSIFHKSKSSESMIFSLSNHASSSEFSPKRLTTAFFQVGSQACHPKRLLTRGMGGWARKQFALVEESDTAVQHCTAPVVS